MSEHYSNLFVAKLPRNLTDKDLLKVFSEFNPQSAKIMLDAATGKSKGFGFVLFASEEEGKMAYDALFKKHISSHGHSFSLRVFPSKHDGRAATEKKSVLFIRNLPIFLSRAGVEKFLQKFGTLTYCSMREDDHDGKVWVVLAKFDTVENATNALQNIHGKSFFRQSVPVIAKYADSDEQKRERRQRKDMNQSVPYSSISPLFNNNFMGQEMEMILSANNVASVMHSPTSIPTGGSGIMHAPPLNVPQNPSPPIPSGGPHDHFSSVHFSHYPPNSSGGVTGPFFSSFGPSSFAEQQSPPRHAFGSRQMPMTPNTSALVQSDPAMKNSTTSLSQSLKEPLTSHALTHSTNPQDHHSYQDFLDPFVPTTVPDTPDYYSDHNSSLSTPVVSHSRTPSRTDSWSYRHNPYSLDTSITSRSSCEFSNTETESSAVYSNSKSVDDKVSFHYSGRDYRSTNFIASSNHFASGGHNFVEASASSR